MRRSPGNPRNDLRSSSRNNPASRFDSPSRSRKPGGHLARNERRQALPGDDDVTTAGAVLEREVEHDVAFVGHARRHLDDDADGAIAERRQRVALRRRPSPSA